MAPINSINEGLARPPAPTGSTPPASVPRTVQSTASSDSRVTDSPSAPGLDDDHAAMTQMVAQMQKAIAGTAAAPHTVAFRQDDSSNDFVIEIRDPHGKLIKQFPPEKVLNLRNKLDELTGMVIDQMT